MKGRNIFWGILFIAATVLLIAGGLGAFAGIGFWTLFGTIVFAAIIIQSCIYRVFAGIFVPIGLLYLIYQQPLGLPYITPWILVIAPILLSIGLHILFRGKPKRFTHEHYHTGYSHGGMRPEGESSQNDDDNFPEISVKFSNVTRYIRSTCLETARFTTHFGSIEAYFDKAVVSPDGAEIILDAHFGGIKLFVPRHWLIENRTSGGMGGIDFKGQPLAQPDSPTVTLTGSVSMAGVEVIYI